MGGLFSSNEKQLHIDQQRQLSSPQPQIGRPISRTTNSSDSRYALQRTHSTTYIREWQDVGIDSYKRSIPQITEQSMCHDFAHLSIRPSYTEKIHVNQILIKKLADCVGVSEWYSKTNDKVFCTEILNEFQEYHAVAAQFQNTNKKCFKIDYIEKVYNIYLYLQFKLRESAYYRRLRWPTTQNLFHGTKMCNIEAICTSNFNWRLRGTALGHRFGQGVSFTNISNYATHYGDLNNFSKVMILAHVLISKTCLGNGSLVIPDEPCDTTTNDKKQVFVKFKDNEFYPCYVIHYSGFDPTRRR